MYVTAHDDVVSVLHAFIVVSANSVKLLYSVFFVLGVTHEKFIDVATGLSASATSLTVMLTLCVTVFTPSDTE